MKTNVKLFFGLLFLTAVLHVKAQGVITKGGAQAGVGQPLDEGGGSPSTSWSTNANGLHVNSYTNIGIGVLLPTRKLDIYGTANTFLRLTSTGSQAGTHVSGIEFKRVAGLTESTWDIVNQGHFRIRKNGIPVMSLDTDDAFFGSINELVGINTWGKQIITKNGVTDDGSLVINNNSPGTNHTLRVDGDQLESATDFFLNFHSNKNVDLVHGGGKVRINTFDEDAQLNLASTDHMQLKLINPGTGIAWRIGVANGNWSAGDGKLLFSKTASSSDAAMVITPAGNVGIGLTTPSKTLQVNGVTSTKILEITGGADFAENFDIAESDHLLPGTVVSISADNSGQLHVSNKAYDKTVAGIVSGAGGIQPGMLMGQEGTIANGKHPVALTGRVYCLADASYGEIKPGDLLTTSQTLGHAMKVSNHEEARGAIIGKAMTSMESGKGLILVLVSLQ